MRWYTKKDLPRKLNWTFSWCSIALPKIIHYDQSKCYVVIIWRVSYSYCKKKPSNSKTYIWRYKINTIYKGWSKSNATNVIKPWNSWHTYMTMRICDLKALNWALYNFYFWIWSDLIIVTKKNNISIFDNLILFIIKKLNDLDHVTTILSNFRRNLVCN